MRDFAALYMDHTTIGRERARALMRLQVRHPKMSFEELDALIVGVPTLEDEQRKARWEAERKIDTYLNKISQGELAEHARLPYRTIDQVFEEAFKREREYKNSKPWTAPDAVYVAEVEKELEQEIGWEVEVERDIGGAPVGPLIITANPYGRRHLP